MKRHFLNRPPPPTLAKVEAAGLKSQPTLVTLIGVDSLSTLEGVNPLERIFMLSLICNIIFVLLFILLVYLWVREERHIRQLIDVSIHPQGD